MLFTFHPSFEEYSNTSTGRIEARAVNLEIVQEIVIAINETMAEATLTQSLISMEAPGVRSSPANEAYCLAP
jgi:hypothetical protein